METCGATQMAPSNKMQQEQAGMLAVTRQVIQPITTSSTLRVEIPFVHYKQTARVQEVELPVELTRVHVEKVEVQAPHEIPIIHPRELGVHQQTRRNIPTPVDVYTVQKYQLPRLRPIYYDVEVPIYVPRYVEVPVPSHFAAYNNEPLPNSLPLGPPTQYGVTSAPVLVNNQVYSLAQGPVEGAPPASHKNIGSRGNSRSAANTPAVVHTPAKEGAFSTSSGNWPSMRTAFFLTPSHKQNATALVDAAAELQQQNTPSATGPAQSDSTMAEVPDVTGVQGVASVGRAASSGSISESSTERAPSVYSSSLVGAGVEESAAADVHQSLEGEPLPGPALACEEGAPPMVQTVA